MSVASVKELQASVVKAEVAVGTIATNGQEALCASSVLENTAITYSEYLNLKVWTSKSHGRKKTGEWCKNPAD